MSQFSDAENQRRSLYRIERSDLLAFIRSLYTDMDKIAAGKAKGAITVPSDAEFFMAGKMAAAINNIAKENMRLPPEGAQAGQRQAGLPFAVARMADDVDREKDARTQSAIVVSFHDPARFREELKHLERLCLAKREGIDLSM